MTNVLVSATGASRLSAPDLQTDGLRLITWPETNFDDPEDSAGLIQAIENLFGYDWLILKNERAAEYFLRRIDPLNQAAVLDDLRVIAIGEATAEKLIQAQIHLDVAIHRFSLKETFSAIESYAGSSEALAGLNFLLPNANITREIFQDQLEDAGARVDSVNAYRTALDRRRMSQLRTLLPGGAITAVLFAGPLEVDELAQLFDTDDLAHLFRGIEAMCSDDETAVAAGVFGLKPTIIRSEESAHGLAEAIISASKGHETV